MSELLQLAASITQVIDGLFEGYDQGAPKPWIIMEAVDSSAFDIQTEDEDVLAKIREHFKEVSVLPE